MGSIFIVIILSTVILGLCFAGLAITIIIKKNGKFPETEIGRNKNMQQLGIRCTKQEELRKWRSGVNPASGNPCSHCAMSCNDSAQ
jgi:hypothetical protein